MGSHGRDGTMISKWIGVLVRLLQRNGANRMDKEIHYEELARVVRKADKSQHLQGRNSGEPTVYLQAEDQQTCKTQKR